MGKYSKHEVALMAELLADKLTHIYQDEQVPAMVDSFSLASFTRTALEQDPVRLYQMLVIAAYDRRPFTPAAGGFEVIWGMRHTTQSIPQVLKAICLFCPAEVRGLDDDAIHYRLDRQSFFGCSLATDGGAVRFGRTLLELARLIESGFHDQVLEARMTKDVQAIYRALTSIHGIGDTIGAKLVKYLLREIGIGQVAPDTFPLMVVWPITGEYHANEAIEKLSAHLDVTLVPLTMGLLLHRGEPFAVDALFYLHRHRSWELDEFIEDAQKTLAGRRLVPGMWPTLSAQGANLQTAQKLLAVIKEIFDGSRGITQAEIKRAGLQGVVTPDKIEASARWLYTEMGDLAAKGNAAEMIAFYHNCLRSEDGKLIGWALQKLGRISMESEQQRFLAIYEGRS